MSLRSFPSVSSAHHGIKLLWNGHSCLHTSAHFGDSSQVGLAGQSREVSSTIINNNLLLIPTRHQALC